MILTQRDGMWVYVTDAVWSGGQLVDDHVVLRKEKARENAVPASLDDRFDDGTPVDYNTVDFFGRAATRGRPPTVTVAVYRRKPKAGRNLPKYVAEIYNAESGDAHFYGAQTYAGAFRAIAAVAPVFMLTSIVVGGLRDDRSIGKK